MKRILLLLLFTSNCIFSQTTLISDIYVGANDSNPERFVEFNGKLYFEAIDSNCICGKIWEYDGVNAPVLSQQMNTVTYYPDILRFSYVFDNKLFFPANGGLTYYDGINNPQAVPDTSPNPVNRNIKYYAVFNNVLYFQGEEDTAIGTELYAYDGTNNPTLIADINPGTGSSRPIYLTVFNNKLYFMADNGTNGEELFVYDGVNPPALVFDINPGVADGEPRYLMTYNNQLYFNANNGVNGKELWTYDGINNPTMVVDLKPGSDGSSPVPRAVINGDFYFDASSNDFGHEVFKYNGPNNLPTVIDINPGTSNATPRSFTTLGNTFYFSATNGTNGFEMWSYNGTSATMVEDINVGANSSGAYEFITFDNKIVFRANNGSTGQELWQFIPAPLSVPEVTAPKYSVFPNPASDLINVTSNSQITNVEVYNLLGKKVISKVTASKSIEIDIQDLNTGIYILKLKSANGIRSMKLIKK